MIFDPHAANSAIQSNGYNPLTFHIFSINVHQLVLPSPLILVASDPGTFLVR